MRIAYFDCPSGISGDMLLGALVDAGVPLAEIQAGIDSLGLPSCQLQLSEVKKKGFRAAKVDVLHEPEHAHRHLHHITAMIEQSRLTDSQRNVAHKIFRCLAEAEAKVHGSTIEKVHFHEVGAVDSIADICGVAIGMDWLKLDRIVCSPVPTGHGFVNIAHGRCSIPAPATAELLTGVPIAACDVEAELTTPTGAAVVKAMVDQFGPLPSMRVDKIGYGAGTKDLDQQANLLRLLIGTNSETALSSVETDTVMVLETNLDDVSGEVLGYCFQQLMTAGALDVFVVPIQMKKQRSGQLLSVICEPDRAAELESILFQETGTLGIRRHIRQRTKLIRTSLTVTTRWGEVRGKQATLPDGSLHFRPEFDDCQRVAQQHGVSLETVMQAAQNQWFAATSV
ncbi:MAG: nickel pincer cofactor biosynthesis protein LarC [Pirellulaceae bacterium]